MRIMLGLVTAAILAASVPPAHAQEWCGFFDRDNSRVRCGFTSVEQCKQALGEKNAICIPDPEFAARLRRAFAPS